jgi:hypothetical protein
VPHNRARAIIGTTLVLLLAATGYGIYQLFGHVTAQAPPPGCQAGTGAQAISLDTEQAGIAATIAGVAARHKLPARAVTIAYAAALQESKLHNLDYGDRDSVGIFQQRPSQGWGTPTQLIDPVYATTKFFTVLTGIRGYTRLPIETAAQDVQHSADGSAYAQWADLARQLAGYFTGASPHGVSCWYSPGGRADADLKGAVRQLTQTFGPPGGKAVVVRITTGRSGKKNPGSAAVVHVKQDAAWAVAGWLVAHAEQYQISEVRYAGYRWRAADGTMGWQHEPGTQGPGHGSIVAG